MWGLILLAATVPAPATPSPNGVPVWAWLLVALGGAAITGLVTYLVARRTSSGRIDTSEAATLWEESNAMRKELRDEVVVVRGKCDILSQRVEELERENTQLKLDALRCKQEADDLLEKLDEVQKKYNALRRRKTTR